MRKDHTKYLGDSKPHGTWTEADLGLDFEGLGLPEEVKPISGWHPDLRYRKEKCIDGTSHHYF